MPSRHPRAAALVAAGLYRHLSSFRELETRIAALPEEIVRGDAFEIFLEGYFWTMRVFQSVDLWLVGQVPLDVRRALNLPADAKGIDGVFRTKAGQDVPYQVKFRIGRAMLGVADVATFLGLTERASDRLLVSNANRCARDVENRDGLRLLRGTDFDALGPENLAVIAAWLDDRPAERSRASPREDQAKALASITDALQTETRATVVMPCGTGKTLVALWAAERLSAKTVLVLVPSLALLSQTLGEWSRHTSWGDRFEYLCVCSDPTVSAEQDAITIRSTNVPFHVDTDPAVVRRFLNRPATDDVPVVFSTYQSVPVVATGVRGSHPLTSGFSTRHIRRPAHQGARSLPSPSPSLRSPRSSRSDTERCSTPSGVATPPRRSTSSSCRFKAGIDAAREELRELRVPALRGRKVRQDAGGRRCIRLIEADRPAPRGGRARGGADAGRGERGGGQDPGGRASGGRPHHT